MFRTVRACRGGGTRVTLSPVRRLLPTLVLVLLAGCTVRLPTRAAVEASERRFPQLTAASVGGERLDDYAERRTALLIDGPNWRFVRRHDGSITFETPGDAASAAVLITSDGYALTSAHGVSTGRTLAALPPERPGGAMRLRPARVVWDGAEHDPPADVAVLKVELLPRDRVAFVPLGDFPRRPPRAGTAVLMTGVAPRDDGGPPSPVTSAGRVIEVERRGTLGHLVVVRAPVRPGFSGGPALDARGRLAGITAQLLTRFRPTALLPVPTFGPRYSTLLVRPDPRLIARVIRQDREKAGP